MVARGKGDQVGEVERRGQVVGVQARRNGERAVLSPSSMAFWFIRSMNEAMPPCEVRASARAAALSDGISRRCSSPGALEAVPGLEIRRRRGVRCRSARW